MTGIDHARLQRLLGGEHLAAVRRRLRRHFMRVDPARASANSLHLGELSRGEYEALASLMGRRLRTSTSIDVDIATIDATLSAAGIAPSLRAALEHLEGPIVHTASARAASDAQWRAVAAACRHVELARLIEQPTGLGLLKRLARSNADAAHLLCERAATVLRRLPANGLTRAQLAAETMSDAHALDAGHAVASLVLAVLRQGSLRETADLDAETSPAAARDERARTLWARSGVLVNELARPALVLNLPVLGGSVADGPVGDDQCVGCRPGEPHYLSLRSLLRHPPAWAVAGRDVYVCENPNVLAIAADRLASACQPLLCTEGMPAAAQRTLLEQLAAAGASLLYHGDFDWPGLRIANVVMRTAGAAPWRFGAADYLSAVAGTSDHPHVLSGDPSEARWDAALAPAMLEHGIAIAEEANVETLLSDLRAPASPCSARKVN